MNSNWIAGAIVVLCSVSRLGDAAADEAAHQGRLSSTPPLSGSSAAVSQGAACAVEDVDYVVSGSIRIRGTTMGAGDGEHRVGPGRIVLRFDEREQHPEVQLLAYDLQENFTVVAKTLLWTTRVDTSVEMRTGTAGAASGGALSGHTVVWHDRVQDVHSDGTLSCEGSMCGKFGAPPPGSSQLHTGPSSLELRSFDFSADMKTFSMPYVVLSKSTQQQTSIALAGREHGRVCASGSTL